MKSINTYLPIIVSAIMLCLILIIIYPYYYLYIDPDGTSYLTIAKRYAQGDYLRAINGYWSPWGCWLTAILIKFGLDAIPSSIVINALGAIGVLFISFSFYIKLNLANKYQWWFGIILMLFLCFAIFHQTFDDIWECFFLLTILRIIIVEHFIEKPVLWILTGIIGTLAYFAKAYSFPFFILNAAICFWFVSQYNFKLYCKLLSVAILILLACSLPWVYLLHNKYGIYTTSTAGTLNTSWYLIGHPYWKDSIQFLIPPVYSNSPYYWEDPYFANANTPHFYDSLALLGMQFIRILLNIYKFIVSLLQISIFFPFIVFGAAKALFLSKKKTILSKELKIIIISFLLFPMGYLLINFESRYIWYMLPIGIFMGLWALQNDVLNLKLKNKWLIPVFLLSFLVYPVWQMVKMYKEGSIELSLAKELKVAKIAGTFTSNRHPSYMARLAYFSGNQYFYNAQPRLKNTEINNPKICKQHFYELEKDMRRNSVKYYFHFYGKPVDDNPNLFFNTLDTTGMLRKIVLFNNNLVVLELLDKK